jgi:hypothetical protein
MSRSRARVDGRAAVAVVALVALAACQPRTNELPIADGTETRSAPNTTATTTTATAGDAQATAPGTTPASEANGAADATQAARRSPPDAAAVEVDADPGRFLDAPAARAAGALGPPDQVRREAGARVWQYRLSGCVLDLFVYPTDGEERVVHMEARDRAGAALGTRPCLADALRRQVAADA